MFCHVVILWCQQLLYILYIWWFKTLYYLITWCDEQTCSIGFSLVFYYSYHLCETKLHPSSHEWPGKKVEPQAPKTYSTILTLQWTSLYWFNIPNPPYTYARPTHAIPAVTVDRDTVFEHVLQAIFDNVNEPWDTDFNVADAVLMNNYNVCMFLINVYCQY